MIGTVILPFTFDPKPWDQAVETVCQSWVGTPYKLNRCVKGARGGVDCVHFVAAVLDELYGIEFSKNLKSLPPDACVHNRRGVMKAGRALLEAYPSHARVEDGTVQAGDLVLTGPVSDTPTTSHLLIAGKKGKLWQCSNVGVNFTGYGMPSSEMLVGIYRASDKMEKWPC